MNKLYLIAGIAGLLLFMVGLIPAPLLYHWSRDNMDPNVQVYGVSGTLWSGEVASVNLHGVRLQTVQWQLRPLSLLFLRLSHDVTAQTDRGQLQAVISRTPLGTVRINDLQASLSVEQLGPALQLPVLPVTGQIFLDLNKVVLRNGIPTYAEGALLFKDLIFSFTSPPATLGSYRAELSTAKDVMRLDVTSESGELDAGGYAEASTEGKYALDMKVRGRANTSAAVASLLQTLGRPDAEGWYHLRRSGVFQVE